MANHLAYSIFQKVFFPQDFKSNERSAFSNESSSKLFLQKLLRFTPPPDLSLATTPIVVFDFETTGLDPELDRIIEIGAIKTENFAVTDQYSSLVAPNIPLTKIATQITGITEDMLVGAPSIDDVLPKFLDFMKGSILVAHNADFDWNFLKAASARLGYDLEWPCFCSLKIARTYLSQLESKSLDAIAAHYGLKFESRHRSMGDIKVTNAFLKELWQEKTADLTEFQHLKPFMVS